MPPVSIPIPAAVQAEVAALLQQVIDKLTPFDITLTDKERKSLASATMGQGSVAFAQEAAQLLTNYPGVLRRSITDADIAGYPTLLATYSAASDLDVKVETVAAILRNVGLVAGSTSMAIARPAYIDGKNDNGKTPGVREIIERMSERFDQSPTDPAEQ